MIRKLKPVAFIAALLLALFGFVACSKAVADPYGGAERLGKVNAETFVIQESVGVFYIEFEKVPHAREYTLSCGSSQVTLKDTYANLRLPEYNFPLPANGKIALFIVAKAQGYRDSEPTLITYTVRGEQLRSPNITSFENGVLEWAADSDAIAYKLSVNGTPVTDVGDGLWHGNTFDVKNYSGAVKISIAAVGDGVYCKDSGATTVRANAKKTALTMLPVESFTIDNGVLKWDAVGGAKAYRVVDLNRSVTTIESTSYDMSDKILVYGVYPVSDSAFIRDAEVEKVAIDYLDGKGTAAEPYLIKTPFDLRAIDYYEAEYEQTVKVNAAAAPNNYRIENDIDYAQVPVGDEESNIYTLSRPFFGVLDGNGKTVSNVRVVYDGGHWALFDFVLKNAVVKNLKFDAPSIVNKLQDKDHPLNAAVSTIADINYGSITGITVADASYASGGGAVCGIASHNYGTVSGCAVSGEFKQLGTGKYGQACYEMAGVVVENCKGGIVSNNEVSALRVLGEVVSSEIYKWNEATQKNELVGYYHYNNIRLVGGIVAVNRAGATVSGNSYKSVTLTNMLNEIGGSDSGWGGLVAYNAGTVTVGGKTLGTLTWGTSTKNGEQISPITVSISRTVGTKTDRRGTQVGNNDGTCN